MNRSRSTAGLVNIFRSVTDFGAVGDDATDNTVALQAARDWLAANPNCALVIPAGTYRYLASPNWAIAGARLIGMGQPHLKCVGSSHGMVIDGGSGASAGPMRIHVEGVDVSAINANAHGIYIRNAHHGRLKDVRVRGAGTSAAGVRTEWIVAWTFDKVSVSGNEGLSPVPAVGLDLDRSDVTRTTAYNTFIDPIIEAVPIGIRLTHADGNVFIGGTSEGCTDTGVYEATTCTGNAFIKMDFEANTNTDMRLAGRGSSITDCDTAKLLLVSGSWNKVRGGFHSAVTVEGTAVGAQIDSIEYNRLADGAAISNSGTQTIIRDSRNATGALFPDIYPQPPQVPTGQVLGASPYTYTNDYGHEIDVSVAGGTVSLLRLIRGASTVDLGITSGVIALSPGDQFQITYSVAPSLVLIPRN